MTQWSHLGNKVVSVIDKTMLEKISTRSLGAPVGCVFDTSNATERRLGGSLLVFRTYVQNGCWSLLDPLRFHIGQHKKFAVPGVELRHSRMCI